MLHIPFVSFCLKVFSWTPACALSGSGIARGLRPDTLELLLEGQDSPASPPLGGTCSVGFHRFSDGSLQYWSLVAHSCNSYINFPVSFLASDFWPHFQINYLLPDPCLRIGF